MRHVTKTRQQIHRKAPTGVRTIDGYPIPAGGAGDGEGGGDGGAGDGGEGGAGGEGSGSGDGGEGGDGLGDAGKRAIQAERDRAKDRDRAAKAAERERDQARQELAALKAKGQTDAEKEAEKAAKAAADEATKTERARSDRRIVAAELKAAATGKLADPADVLVFVDRDGFTVDDDGEVDQATITKAVDELLKKKPHLAKDPGSSGDFDQGARGAPSSTDVKPGLPRLRHAYAETAKK